MIRVKHLLSLGVSLCLLALGQQALAAVNVGDKPILDFQATDGTKISPQTLKGKIVVVDFWATWCGPCMAEAEHMVKINETYSKQGLQFIGISLDQDRGALDQIVKEKGFVWPQFFDGQGWGNRFAKEWGVSGIPATFILSPDGEVLWKGHPQQIDRALTDAFQNHPPRLIDPETLAKVKTMLDKAEAAMKDNKPSAAIALAAKLPAEARSEKEIAPRVDALLKELEAYGDTSLVEAEEAIEKKDFPAAVAKLRDLSKLSALASGKKAADRLKAVMAMPQAKAAIAEAEKAEKEKERAAKADELLEAARKQQEGKKHEQAFAQFKLIVQQYAGTDAAKTAAAEVKKYESDPAFVKKANEAAAAGKAKGMISMAASYKSAGRTDLAKQKYQQVITDFPGTSFAEQAKRELEALK